MISDPPRDEIAADILNLLLKSISDPQQRMQMLSSIACPLQAQFFERYNDEYAL